MVLVAFILAIPSIALAQNPPSPAPLPEAPKAKPGSPPGAANSQRTPPQGDTRAVIKTRTELVVVPVTVKDAEGRLVGDLQKDDFRVFEDGVEQDISLFTSEAFPLSAVILIDNDLSQKQAGQVQKSLTAIAAAFGPSDEAAIVLYDQYPQKIFEFSVSNDSLFTRLQRIELKSHFAAGIGGPMTGGPKINNQSVATGVPTVGAPTEPTTTKDLDDALYAAGEMLRGRGRDRRKIIFLISDGNNSRNNEHSFDQTLHLLLEADVSVYSISVGHAFLQHETGRLEKYAGGTGGDTFFAAKQQDLERLYSRVSEEARTQYTLAFTPQGADSRRDYHAIEVRVRRSNLDILAREGYYTSAANSPR
jgi:Ca-activated chloride channel family protein